MYALPLKEIKTAEARFLFLCHTLHFGDELEKPTTSRMFTDLDLEFNYLLDANPTIKSAEKHSKMNFEMRIE